MGLLWGKPQRYADFLGQELVYFWKGPTLVVMPQGYGVFAHGKKLQLLAKNDMNDIVHSTPVVAGGVLYVATRAKLYAIVEKK